MSAAYVPVWGVDCTLCGTQPVVSLETPGGQIACTQICGPHFFGDRAMADSDNWNEPRDATE